jgi:Uma2 family endonuclease
MERVMALLAEKTILTREAFLDWDHARCDDGPRYEFWQGEVFAMTGARQIHVLVSLNLAAALKQHLRGCSCRAYMADMAVESAQTNAVLYPDVVVSCHPDDLKAERVLQHPKVVIEVLSESTAAYDRGKKFAAYRTLPDLQEYVLIDPDRRSLEIYRRAEGNDWLLALDDSARGLVLPSLGAAFPLEVVFEDLPDSDLTSRPRGQA